MSPETSFAGPLLLSLRLALTTTAVLALIGIPLAWWLSLTRSPLRPLVSTCVTLPIVLPPTVLGFYLLAAFSPLSPPGRILHQWLGTDLVFSFTGLVTASVVYSLPFMVNPLLAGLEALPAPIREASLTLGRSEMSTLVRVMLPAARPSLVTALVLTFAHTVGEFGVVLMIGGNIPGVTRVASIAIYHEVERMNYGGAHVYSLILLSFSFVVLLAVSLINRRSMKTF